ncbi:MAG: response regulator transcription factor [Fibrobacteria bacterium]|nr:response regulator transcription factor [Fibrobacteria bacterium]
MIPAILLADDHHAMLLGIRTLVGILRPEAFVVEVSDAQSLRERLLERRWDLVVMDQTFPGENGLDVLESVGLDQPVLVHTMHNSPEILRRSRAAGAWGFVSKSSDPEVLERAMVRILSGEKDFSGADPFGTDLFSTREREVMDLLLEGKGPKDIARTLEISQSSVQTHTGRLLRKIGLTGVRELFRWAAARGTL